MIQLIIVLSGPFIGLLIGHYLFDWMLAERNEQRNIPIYNRYLLDRYNNNNNNKRRKCKWRDQ